VYQETRIDNNVTYRITTFFFNPQPFFHQKLVTRLFLLFKNQIVIWYYFEIVKNYCNRLIIVFVLKKSFFKELISNIKINAVSCYSVHNTKLFSSMVSDSLAHHPIHYSNNYNHDSTNSRDTYYLNLIFFQHKLCEHRNCNCEKTNIVARRIRSKFKLTRWHYPQSRR